MAIAKPPEEQLLDAAAFVERNVANLVRSREGWIQRALDAERRLDAQRRGLNRIRIRHSMTEHASARSLMQRAYRHQGMIEFTSRPVWFGRAIRDGKLLQHLHKARGRWGK
jgi:hypothetical protein